MTQEYACEVHRDQSNRAGFGRHFDDARNGKRGRPLQNICGSGDPTLELMTHETAQRMPPVHASVVVVVVQRLAMFLPELVGKQERDDKKRHDQKRAQNQMLDHSKPPDRWSSDDFIVGVLRVTACDPSRTPCAPVDPCKMRACFVVAAAQHQLADFFHAAASTPAPISSVPPVQLMPRCTRGLRIARRAADASIA
jgi:hypothetical protein